MTSSPEAESDDDLLTMQQAADLTPFTVAAFRKWRMTWPTGACKGPMPLLIEGRVFYRRGVVKEWLNGSTSANQR